MDDQPSRSGDGANARRRRVRRVVALGAVAALIGLLVIAALIASGAAVGFVAVAIVGEGLIVSGIWGLFRNPRWRQ